MKSISLPPSAAALMESTRSIGYSLEAAVADIIDNSIAAGATTVDIKFSPTGVINPFIAILDNGEGMSADELQAAMQYGCKNPLSARNENDLGRYGLGLKTASLSQCQILTVASKKNNCISCCSWNLHHIRRKDSWELLVLNDDEAAQLPCINLLENCNSGTLVVWQDLDRIFASGDIQRDVIGAKMIKVREHLSLVFHRYLAGEDEIGKVGIFINNNPLTPIDPFLRGRSTKPMDDEKLIIKGSHRVVVKTYILPHTSRLSHQDLEALGGKDGLRKSQGFYIYRNKRLVVWGTWFRMMVKGDLSKLARIQVDIPNTLDDLWTLDIKKSTAIPPEEVQQNLRKIVEKVAERSKDTWTFRGRKEQSMAHSEVWGRVKTREGGFRYQINTEHLLIKNIFEAYPNAKRSLEALFHLIEGRLPLNSLYLDLVQDEKVTNNDEALPSEILDQIKNILTLYPDASSKKTALTLLLNVSPFDKYKEFIMKKMENILESI